MAQNPRLLLINPWIYDFTAFDLWTKPIGLLYIASYLRQVGYHIDSHQRLRKVKWRLGNSTPQL